MLHESTLIQLILINSIALLRLSLSETMLVEHRKMITKHNKTQHFPRIFYGISVFINNLRGTASNSPPRRSSDRLSLCRNH